MAHDLVLLTQALKRSATRLALIGLLLPLCGLSACGGSTSEPSSAQPSATMSLEAPTWLNSGVRVMALGDSLTEGWPSTYGGYRFELYRRFIAAKLPVNFVGSVTNASYGLPDPNHEGHGGWTSYDLRDGRPNGLDNGNVRNWLGAWHPEVILLLAGTNDVFYTQGDDTIAANLLALIDRIREVAPNAELFVGSTLPLADPGLAARVVRFNAIVQQGLATRMQLDPHLHSVPTHDALSVDDLSDDGVHIRPEGPGNAKLADVWFSAIRPTLERLNTR